MSTLYYKTEKTSESGLKMQALIAVANNAKEVINEFLKSIDATPEFVTSDRYVFGTGLVAVKFDYDPDTKLWKEFKGYKGGYYYVPRGNSKEGRALQNKIYELPFVEHDDVNKVIGIKDFFKRVGYNLGKDLFGFSIDSNWNHTMPKDCIEITGSEYENL